MSEREALRARGTRTNARESVRRHKEQHLTPGAGGRMNFCDHLWCLRDVEVGHADPKRRGHVCPRCRGVFCDMHLPPERHDCDGGVTTHEESQP